MGITVDGKRRRAAWERPSLDSRISWIERDPHVKRGEAGQRFSRYHGAATVAEYLGHGGTWADLRYDVEHNLLGLRKPHPTAGGAPDQSASEARFVPPGGIYIVTLNNEALISTQAHDRRFDDQKVLMVNRENRKCGKAMEFSGRERQGYERTFGAQNVNFIPVIAVVDAERVETTLKHRFRPWRLRSPKGRLTEWTAGIDTSSMTRIIVGAAHDLGVQHTVLRMPGG